jgi:uncharacterized protein YcfJ
MRNFTKGLLGAIAATAVMASAPVYAGVSTAAKAPGYHASEQTSDFYKKKRKYRDRDRYARNDQRVNSNTRVWRDNDGRYRCKKDNGTTGLLIGGAVGGVAGHEIAGGGDKLLGTVIGAAGGALLGREIDKSGYRCR